MFMRLAASSAFDILTKEGRAAVATYNFIDGRDDPRTRSKEHSWQHLLQVEAKRSVRFKDKFAFTIGPDGVKWYHCDVPGCTHKAKRVGDLKKHKQSIHDFGVMSHRCDQEGCTYKAKKTSHLKSHKSSNHNIGVVLHPCTVEGCDFAPKQASDLKRHKKRKHP
ncbi:hypothetical protein TrST_g779 [Triparma strigata]|uniref:C2H2-type domain-containing protein n=1 Tax=Triparma strigata TaxID=1606541 RepID=A0A9W7AQP7_9STRA|nr:hypothetical protein TrST_g779 [Triparma strigata]